MDNTNIEVEFGYGNVLVKKFDISTMCENSAILVIGKRNCGKSWLCRHILNNATKTKTKTKTNTNAGIIFSLNDSSKPVYSKCFPQLFIHDEFTEEKISKVLDRQKTMYDNNKIIDLSFIIMDDCCTKDYFRKKQFEELVYNGRHYKTMYFLTIQCPVLFKPEIRVNFDYVILFGDNVCSNVKRMYDQYGGMFPCFSIFKQVFDKLTQDYGAMVIVHCNAHAHKGINERIFWIKADDVTDGDLIGSCEFWDYHNKYYCGENYVEEEFIEDKDVHLFSAFADVNKMHCRKHDPDTSTNTNANTNSDEKTNDDMYSDTAPL